jgi:hypothetical protein
MSNMKNELQVAEDVATARNTGFGQAIGSQYFGPMLIHAMPCKVIKML